MLNDQHREILAFERQWWQYAGAKEQAIHDRFGMAPSRYHLRLNWLLDEPAALEHDALVVRPLRRLRETRTRRRPEPVT